MNYRHLYHAGNFSDTFKHLMLISLIQSLCHKTQPFTYFETHAGLGGYDLTKAAAQKSQEFRGGIAKIFDLPDPNRPGIVGDYLHLVQAFNQQQQSEKLRYYPGSPKLVRALLRAQDRMILCELHPRDVLSLKQGFRGDAQVAVHHINGYLGLKAFLPPPQKRGLVLIDPPFELVTEWDDLLTALEIARQRWSTATYAVWYPIKERSIIAHFHERLKKTAWSGIFYNEMTLPVSAGALMSCGMVILQPPWRWADTLATWMPWLVQQLSLPGKGEWRRGWLKRPL